MDRARYRALAKIALAVAGGPIIGGQREPRASDPLTDAQRKRQRRRTRERVYGLSHDQFEAMVTAQGGACAICGTQPSDPERGLVVDHDHTTGAVRALLCNQCNSGIGMLKDDAARCIAAAEYLTRHATPISTAA